MAIEIEAGQETLDLLHGMQSDTRGELGEANGRVTLAARALQQAELELQDAKEELKLVAERYRLITDLVESLEDSLRE